MTNLANKISRNIYEIKFYKSLPKRLIWFLKRKYHEKILFKIASNESIFTSVWRNNYWGSSESVSGPGSTLEHTKSVRSELPKIFDKFAIKSIFDAPCGDLNWMLEVINNSDINYIGGDIVKGIIEKNKLHHNLRANFLVFDITTQNFPKSDLWLCRDVLFHLSYQDILNSLKQFVKSDIPYFLTTTHKNNFQFENKDILTGGFRMIDLFQAPFNFPAAVLYRFDDYIETQPPREMCLFSREQILEILPKFEISIKK
jgi:hypothetical protein